MTNGDRFSADGRTFHPHLTREFRGVFGLDDINFGTPERIRTSDLYLRRVALYPTELQTYKFGSKGRDRTFASFEVCALTVRNITTLPPWNRSPCNGLKSGGYLVRILPDCVESRRYNDATAQLALKRIFRIKCLRRMFMIIIYQS